MDSYFLEEVEKEYKKIDLKWLILHFHISFYSVILTFLLECLLGLLMYHTGEISSTIPVYLIKFLIIPSALNFLFIIFEYKHQW
jgi:diguanylate cyclase